MEEKRLDNAFLPHGGLLVAYASRIIWASNDYEHQEAARRATIELGPLVPLAGGLLKEVEDTVHKQSLADGLIDLDNNLTGIIAGPVEVPRCPKRPKQALKQGAGGR